MTVLLASALITTVTACAPNDRDLATAAKVYFSKSTPPIQAYRLLSTASRAQTSMSVFTDSRRNHWELDEVAVLGEETLDGVTYGRVIRWVHHPTKACREALTSTWVREDGRWRVLQSSRISSQIRRAYAARDFAEVLTLVDGWLAINPLSVAAHLWRLDARSRLGGTSAKGALTTAQLVASLLAINPNDDYSLTLAISHVETLEEAKAHFASMPLDSCVRDEAAFRLVSRLPSAAEKLAFLDEVKREGPSLSAARIEALHAAGRGGDALNLLLQEGRAIHDAWKATNPLDGPEWALRLGMVAASNGDAVEAMRWRSLAVALSPRGVDTSQLDQLLEDATRTGE